MTVVSFPTIHTGPTSPRSDDRGRGSVTDRHRVKVRDTTVSVGKVVSHDVRPPRPGSKVKVRVAPSDRYYGVPFNVLSTNLF